MAGSAGVCGNLWRDKVLGTVRLYISNFFATNLLTYCHEEVGRKASGSRGCFFKVSGIVGWMTDWSVNFGQVRWDSLSCSSVYLLTE